MIIMPSRPALTVGRSDFWVPPPAPPVGQIDLAIVEHTGHRYSSWGVSSAINLPLTAEGGVKSGDLLVAFLSIDSDIFNQWTTIASDGFTQKGYRARQNGGGAVMVKVCDGTETSPTSMSFNSATAQAWGYETFRIEGADPTTAVHGHTYLGYDFNSTNFTPNSITTTISGCLHLTFVVGGWAPYSFTTPAPYVEQFDRAGNAGSSWTSFAGGAYIQPEAGNLAAGNHACSASLWRSMLHHMAIAPAP